MFRRSNKPLIMGILNITPDSFSDGGLFNSLENAVQRAEIMISEGADILDIGGESTRPGSDPVSSNQQIQRVLPIIEAIRSRISQAIPISIDTTSSVVAEAAIKAGATLINDVSAATNDPQMLTLAAETGKPIILMHSQGTPKTMQDNPFYKNVIQEVVEILQDRTKAALQAGIAKDNIIIDPGIGFGKRKQDNLDLLAGLEQIVALGFPVLLGTSRKRFMGSICAVENPADLVTATAVTTALGVMAGVNCFRVHDIRENRQAADVAWAIKQSR